MHILGSIIAGFGVALTPENFLYCLLGATFGTLVGVLPGIGPLTTIAMLLPLTFKMTPVASLIMLSGIYYGAHHAGSTTAIMLNTPGDPIVAGDLPRRPSDGAPRTRRTGAVHRGDRIVFRRQFRRAADGAVLPAAGGGRAAVRRAGIHLPACWSR